MLAQKSCACSPGISLRSDLAAGEINALWLYAASARYMRLALIFDVGMYEYNSGFVFMPLDTAQTFFQLPGAVTALEIFWMIRKI